MGTTEFVSMTFGFCSDVGRRDWREPGELMRRPDMCRKQLHSATSMRPTKRDRVLADAWRDYPSTIRGASDQLTEVICPQLSWLRTLSPGQPSMPVAHWGSTSR